MYSRLPDDPQCIACLTSLGRREDGPKRLSYYDVARSSIPTLAPNSKAEVRDRNNGQTGM